MTTIISRLYNDEATAGAVLAELKAAGFTDEVTDMVAHGAGTRRRIEKTGVDAAAASAYARKMVEGNALVVVRAPVVPFGAARGAMRIVDSQPKIDAGVANENVYVSDSGSGSGSGGRRDEKLSINADHPRYMTPDPKVQPMPHGTITGALGFRLLSSRRPKNTVMPGGPHMSTSFWPAPLVKTTERNPSVMPGAPYMSKSFWPAPLVTRRERPLSVRKGGGFPFSEAFGLPMIIRR